MKKSKIDAMVAQVLKRYKTCFRDRDYVLSFVLSFIFFILSAIVSFFAIVYATENAGSPVTDFILSNIPVFDVDGLFMYGPIVFGIIIAFYLILNPKKIPFSLKSIALFLCIRSIAINLTHIGPFPTHIQINPFGGGFLKTFISGNDLFFSGHTGLPFLLALIFWNKKFMRYVCLFVSVFFGAVVLMAHLHYSIDVFAAFFITYSVFKIAEALFKKDYLFSEKK